MRGKKFAVSHVVLFNEGIKRGGWKERRVEESEGRKRQKGERDGRNRERYMVWGMNDNAQINTEGLPADLRWATSQSEDFPNLLLLTDGSLDVI